MAGGGKGVTPEDVEEQWVTTSAQVGRRTSHWHCAVKSDTHRPMSALAVACTPLAFATSFPHTLPHCLARFPSPVLEKGRPAAISKYAVGRPASPVSLGVQQSQVKDIRFTLWYRG